MIHNHSDDMYLTLCTLRATIVKNDIEFPFFWRKQADDCRRSIAAYARFLSAAFLLLIVSASEAVAQGNGPSYGPPSILWSPSPNDGSAPVIYSYNSTGFDDFGDPADFYGPPGWQPGGGQIFVDNNQNLYDSYDNFWGWGYDYVHQLGWAQGGNYGDAFYALAADGVTLLGIPHGIVVYSNSEEDILNSGGPLTPNFGSGQGLFVPPFSNGSTWVGHYFAPASYVQFGSSPWYWYQGDSSGINSPYLDLAQATEDFVVDARNGWPASNIFQLPAPQQIYADGETFNLTTTVVQINSGEYSDTLYYTCSSSSGDYFEIQRNAVNGTTASGGYTYGTIYGLVGSDKEEKGVRSCCLTFALKRQKMSHAKEAANPIPRRCLPRAGPG